MKDDYELLKTAAALDAAKNNDVNTLAELFVMDLDDATKEALANALEKEASSKLLARLARRTASRSAGLRTALASLLLARGRGKSNQIKTLLRFLRK